MLRDDALDHGILHVPSAELAATAFRLAARTDLGAVLVLHAPQGAPDDATITSLVAPCPAQRAALLVCAMGETTGALHRATLGSAGLPVFADAKPRRSAASGTWCPTDTTAKPLENSLPARS